MLRVPDHPLIERIVVGTGFDAADDWIAEASDAGTVVVTAAILLAERCLKAGAAVTEPNGKPFTSHSIGSAIATQDIMEHPRAGGAPKIGRARRRERGWLTGAKSSGAL